MEMNQFTDTALFCGIFLSVGAGWFLGYSKGVINGYRHAKAEEMEEHPIANIMFNATDNEDEYMFVNMATGEFVLKGSFDDCIEKVKGSNANKMVIFTNGDDEDE